MAENQFIARKGLISLDDTQITGSLGVTGAVTASTFIGDGSQLTGVDGFPFTGSAEISGSLTVEGPITATTFIGDGSQLTGIQPLSPISIQIDDTDSPFTITNETIIIANSTDGDITINLPDLDAIIDTPDQKPILVYKNDYSQNVVYVQPSGSQLVNGSDRSIIVSIQVGIIYNPTPVGWVTETLSAQSLAELELFFVPRSEIYDFGFATTSSLNSFTSSVDARLDAIESVTGSYATTGSNAFDGSQIVTGSLTVTGDIVAQTLNVQQVTSSVVYSSGSNVFGNSLANTHEFTGSLQVSGSSHYLLGNVGIGTVSPSNLLHIYGTDGNSYLRWTSDVATTGTRIGYNGTEFRIDQQQNADVTIRTNGSEKMRITSDGNVGIGAPNPDVYGFGSGGKYLTLQNTAGFSVIKVISNGTDGSGISFGNATIRRASIDALNGSNLEFYTNETNSGTTVSPRMRITSGGNVLINSTSDNGARLQVNGAVTAGVQSGYSYYANHTSAYSFLFSQINGANTIAFDNSSGTLQVYTGNSLRLTIASSGAATFSNSITSSYTYNGGGVGMLHLTSGGTEGGGITFEKTSGTAQKYKIGNSGTAFFVYDETGAKQPFTILNNGNVGIGNTTPNRLLSLYSTVPVLQFTNPTTGVTANDGTQFFQNAENFTLELQDGGYFNILTGGSERLRITSDGYTRLSSNSLGIQFKGNTSASTALNDYEEGTWTPRFVGASGEASYSTRYGWYTKIGKQVTIVWFVNFQKNTMTGGLRMVDLPFTLLSSNSSFYPQGPVLLDNLSTVTNNITFQGANNSTTGDFIGGNGGTSTHTGLSTNLLGSGTMVCRGTLTYFTA